MIYKGREIVDKFIFLFMKSEEKAQRTFKNICNNSTAKYQFTFGREIRFKERKSRRFI